MGERNHARQLADAKYRYMGAVRRLEKALAAWEDSGMPMDPGPGPEPYPWTRAQIAAIREVATRFQEVIDARRSWDGLRREWRPTH